MNERETFKFRLYVAGNAQNAAQAIANLGRLCWEHLPVCAGWHPCCDLTARATVETRARLAVTAWFLSPT